MDLHGIFTSFHCRGDFFAQKSRGFPVGCAEPGQSYWLKYVCITYVERIVCSISKIINGQYQSGWWFGTCFIFHNIWDNPSH